MRKQSVLLIAMFLALAVAGYPQSSSSSSQSSNPDTSMQSGSSASGSASSSSQGDQNSSAASARSHELQGCIIREETDYYIQPLKGSRVRLKGGSEDLSQYVGKNVDVHGRWNPYKNNNENDHQATTQPSGAPITGAASKDAGEAGQLFLVTRVDKIADTCPTGTPGNRSNPQ